MGEMVKSVWDSMSPRLDLAAFVSETILRLVLAAVLGGLIGLEREMKRKPAGLRTNMFICFGAAMFTILSIRLSVPGADPARIAAQIIPGIGFIGAGSILHAKGSVSGITTAATLFVVASVGMAVGGGQYAPAIFATIVILLSLNILGRLENRLNFKSVLMSYEVAAKDPETTMVELNRILEEERLIMQTVQVAQGAGHHRILFTVEALNRQHNALGARLREASGLERMELVRGSESE